MYVYVYVPLYICSTECKVHKTEKAERQNSQLNILYV